MGTQDGTEHVVCQHSCLNVLQTHSEHMCDAGDHNTVVALGDVQFSR